MDLSMALRQVYDCANESDITMGDMGKNDLAVPNYNKRPKSDNSVHNSCCAVEPPIRDQGPCLPTWINFNPSIDKWSHTQ